MDQGAGSGSATPLPLGAEDDAMETVVESREVGESECGERSPRGEPTHAAVGLADAAANAEGLREDDAPMDDVDSGEDRASGGDGLNAQASTEKDETNDVVPLEDHTGMSGPAQPSAALGRSLKQNSSHADAPAKKSARAGPKDLSVAPEVSGMMPTASSAAADAEPLAPIDKTPHNVLLADRMHELEQELNDMVEHANYAGAAAVQKEISRLGVSRDLLRKLTVGIEEKLKSSITLAPLNSRGKWIRSSDHSEARVIAAWRTR